MKHQVTFENIILAPFINIIQNYIGGFGAKTTSRVKCTDFGNLYIYLIRLAHGYDKKTNAVARTFSLTCGCEISLKNTSLWENLTVKLGFVCLTTHQS